MIHTHKRLKERFLIRQNRTKRANFRGSPLFQATYNIKTEKKTQLIQLILCHLGVGGWRNDWKKKDFLENEHILSCFVRIKSSFNLLWVLDFFFFFQNAGCQLCFRFCCCHLACEPDMTTTLPTFRTEYTFVKMHAWPAIKNLVFYHPSSLP